MSNIGQELLDMHYNYNLFCCPSYVVQFPFFYQVMVILPQRRGQAGYFVFSLELSGYLSCCQVRSCSLAHSHFYYNSHTLNHSQHCIITCNTVPYCSWQDILSSLWHFRDSFHQVKSSSLTYSLTLSIKYQSLYTHSILKNIFGIIGILFMLSCSLTLTKSLY